MWMKALNVNIYWIFKCYGEQSKTLLKELSLFFSTTLLHFYICIWVLFYLVSILWWTCATMCTNICYNCCKSPWIFFFFFFYKTFHSQINSVCAESCRLTAPVMSWLLAINMEWMDGWMDEWIRQNRLIPALYSFCPVICSHVSTDKWWLLIRKS